MSDDVEDGEDGGDRPGPVRPGEELPLGPLAAWLGAQPSLALWHRSPPCRHEPAPAPLASAAPLSVEQFPGGHSNLTYLLHWHAGGERELVLRRPPFGSKVRTAHDMGREYRVLSCLAGHYSKAPRALAAGDDAAVIGAPFYLMERAPGVILRRPRLPRGHELPPAHLRALSEAVVDALIELHAVDWRAAGLTDLGRPDGYSARQVSGWTERWQRAMTEPVPDVDKAAAWLAEHLPRRSPAEEDGAAALIHNDFKYDNLVLTPGLDGVAKVLDWEMATTGEPLMDLGTSLGYWLDPDDDDALRSLPVGPTAVAGSLSRAAVVERYARRSGRDVSEILFYYVFGLLKIAVIAQQIYFRYRQGLTQDERFASLLAGVRLLGRTAAQVIARRRIEGLWS